MRLPTSPVFRFCLMFISGGIGIFLVAAATGYPGGPAVVLFGIWTGTSAWFAGLKGWGHVYKMALAGSVLVMLPRLFAAASDPSSAVSLSFIKMFVYAFFFIAVILTVILWIKTFTQRSIAEK